MTLSKKGFSLIEALIAVAIIGTMSVAASALLQRLPVQGAEIRDQDLALKIARNEIEILRATGYNDLPMNGSFTNPLLGSLASGTTTVTITDFNAKTKRVDVSVLWQGDGSVSREVSLVTLITQDSALR